MAKNTYELEIRDENTSGNVGYGGNGGSNGGGGTPLVELKTKEYRVYVRDSSSSEGISGASVTFLFSQVPGYNLIDKTAITPSSGKTKVSQKDKDTPYSVQCRVNCTGYASVSNIEVEARDLNEDGYTEIRLTKSGPVVVYTYYNVYVTDTSGLPISGARVKLYKDLTETTLVNESSAKTGSDGKYSYTTIGNIPYYYAEISKTGYTTSDRQKVQLRNTKDENPTIFTLQETPKYNYYYVISVKDDEGVYIDEDAYVRLYKNNTYSTPYYKGSINKNSPDQYRYEILGRIQDIITTKCTGIKFQDIKPTIKFNELGIESEKFNNEIIPAIENVLESGDTIHIDNPSNYYSQSITTLINYIFSNTNVVNLSQSVFKINNEPLSIFGGSYISAPNPIYARGVYVNSQDYTFSNESGYTSQGKVVAGTEEDEVKLKLIVKFNNATGRKYYNFKIIDKYTQQPITALTVYFFKINSDDTTTQIAYSRTNSYGFCSFSSSLDHLTCYFIKDGYGEFSECDIDGLNSIDQYYSYALEPLYSIKIYIDNQPAYRQFFVEIDNDKGTYIRKCRSYTTGYLETLPESYYNSGYYAKVLGYNVKENERDSLKIKIEATNNIINLPIGIAEEVVEDKDWGKFRQMSVNAIKEYVNVGNKELEKELESEKVEYNKNDENNYYRINIIDPESISVYDIFTCIPVMVQNNNESIVGSVDMGLKKNINDLRVKIINRYSGYYNPIFKDILFYNDLDNDCSYSNTSFDYTYEDVYGKFGIINNLWFHKVNDNKDTMIVNSLEPYYPLTGQYAIDYRDYNIFESNWDMNYYTRQLDVKTYESCNSISSMKNGLCMFGSKYLNVPAKIEICGFRLGNDVNWKGEWNDDWIDNPDGCPGEMMFKEINDNSVDFYFFFKKRILRHFRENLESEFKKYISDKYSFGKEGLDDDIEEYVIKNVLKLYRLDKVRLFVRRIKKGKHNSKIENDYTRYLEYDKNNDFCDVAYFRKHGFIEINNISMSKINRDDFDRKLVYNLKNGFQEELGFSFILKKI